ncbi:MAG TPA: c-type cytochrome [Roseiarcus sp.]|nr:c-type cytochrome [Roseiarcus sp.]
MARGFAQGARFAALAVVALSLAGEAQAQGSAKAGRQKAEKCAVCHGFDGLAKVAEAPNLAGQNERYLVEQLGAFKSGVRQNEMMSIVIKDLSATDIEDLAAYYAAIEITVGKIPGQ